MKQSIACLVTPEMANNDNHQRIPAIFRAAGWRVVVALHDALRVKNQAVMIDNSDCQSFDLIWPIGLGPHTTFVDRIQILSLIDQPRLITQAMAYVTLHGKTAWLSYAPSTVVARDAASIMEHFEHNPGEWVLKPVAGSFGHGVQRITRAVEIHQAINTAPDQFWMLQRYIPEIAQGETRTLVCGTKVLGSYLRRPNPTNANEFRSNMGLDALAEPAIPNQITKTLIADVHRDLCAAGIGFASIDTAGGYLIEVNIANPGGLGTMCKLYGNEFTNASSQAVVTAATEQVAANS